MVRRNFNEDLDHTCNHSNWSELGSLAYYLHRHLFVILQSTITDPSVCSRSQPSDCHWIPTPTSSTKTLPLPDTYAFAYSIRSRRRRRIEITIIATTTGFPTQHLILRTTLQPSPPPTAHFSRTSPPPRPPSHMKIEDYHRMENEVSDSSDSESDQAEPIQVSSKVRRLWITIKKANQLPSGDSTKHKDLDNPKPRQPSPEDCPAIKISQS